MAGLIQKLEAAHMKSGMPDLRPGYTVEVSVRVIEGDKERQQKFRGEIINVRGGGISKTFTVRKVSEGVGVERTFPLHSPKIERIEVVAIGDVNRAKLYYLREKVGKKARVRAVRRTDKLVSADVEELDEEELDEEPAVDEPVGEAAAEPTTEAEPESVEPADEAPAAEAAPEAEAAEQEQQETGEKTS